ncbi:excalibur calcium-binding domain-containing protein [Sphingopyxis sp.]|uniref:excalibur calcium-binding domain-containing protein n=1 Tax=Sphingopyxis sp. TaxID=1908224 RepID=UPI0025E215D1|nr:excalibur calcium-binding domain-containing protein [Sphingopyxis sp.]
MIALQTKPELSNGVLSFAQSPDEKANIEQSAYYRDCAAARLAGAAPIYDGSPGYRAQLDRDDDGIACEPYRGK